MIAKTTLACALTVLILLSHGVAGAQGPGGKIDELFTLDNESVRIALLRYEPGADSGIHLNLGPEITIVQEGELALYTSKGRELVGAGTAHWLPAFSAHLARNEGDRPVKFWSLLLKGCE
jgi:quercetin dioxygenase-like cupin family protein